ncbi:Uncharacterised protein [Salmonella bongori]|nr:Uncharacterised protein [Salmonella bongori]
MDVGIDNDQGEQGCKRQRLRLYTLLEEAFILIICLI